MRSLNNQIIGYNNGKSILIDVDYVIDAKATVVFCHGFKGFKDYGCFPLFSKRLSTAGFTVVRMSFSHNGTTPTNPTEFMDLDAFAENNFSKELDDLGQVLDWISTNGKKESGLNAENIYLIGHSRGGGTVLLKAAEDIRVRKVATLAAVGEYGKFWDEKTMGNWKEDRVLWIDNKRTRQKMPLNYQLYDDYFDNLDRLHIPKAVQKLNIPLLVIHGTNDETVPLAAAHEIAANAKNAQLLELPNANHVFGASHPYDLDELPEDMDKALKAIVHFFES